MLSPRAFLLSFGTLTGCHTNLRLKARWSVSVYWKFSATWGVLSQREWMRQQACASALSVGFNVPSGGAYSRAGRCLWRRERAQRPDAVDRKSVV